MIGSEDPEAVATDEFYGALLEDDPEELYENAPCAYLSTLPDGTIVKLNRTFTAWTGHERVDVAGRRRLQDILPPGARIHYETHLAPLLRMQGVVREIAAEVVCADGRRLPVLLNAVAKLATDGTPLTFRIALFDARERRSYEHELLAALRRAEASEARARALASTLQESFLPPEILTIEGMDLAGAYRPAGDGTEVGGDFYDVFDTGHGSWGVVLGDVMGKGAAAAAVTSLARYTVRAESLHTSSPAAVLEVVHTALRRYQPDSYCTALLLFLERADEGFRVQMSSGGHPLPIRLRDGTLERVGSTGTALGLLRNAYLHDETFPLGAGEMLLLHTDGVTEARAGDDFLGEDGLDHLLRSVPGASPRALIDHVVDEVVAMQSGRPRDDIAVVAMQPTG